MHVLGELASAGTISVACSQAVRLVRIVLDYRVRCKEIELRRAKLGLTPGSRPLRRLLRGTPSGVARTVSRTA